MPPPLASATRRVRVRVKVKCLRHGFMEQRSFGVAGLLLSFVTRSVCKRSRGPSALDSRSSKKPSQSPSGSRNQCATVYSCMKTWTDAISSRVEFYDFTAAVNGPEKFADGLHLNLQGSSLLLEKLPDAGFFRQSNSHN